MKLTHFPLYAAALALAFPLATSVQAVTFGFAKLTSNSSSNVASQLGVDVTDAGGGLVAFKFTNNVGIASSITDIYFQASGFSAPFTITDSGAGVDFASPANPSELPGANLASPQFVTTLNLSADSTAPVTANGVNVAGEWVTLTFGVGGYTNFAGVLSAIDNGSLRMGLHVQAQGTDGNSDGYINTGGETPGVPDGGSAVALLGLALGSLAVIRRKLA